MDHRKPVMGPNGEFVAEQPHPSAETPDQRTKRLEREREMIEEARRDIREGRFIADEDVDAWLERFVRGEPLPIPDGPAKSSDRR